MSINQYHYAEAEPANLADLADPTGEIIPVAILIGTAARAYGACLARCTAQEVVLDALMGGCVDVGNSAKNCALSCLNPLNWGGKGIGKFGLKGGKPYSNPKRRPRYGKGQRDTVWENAKDENGRVYDPKTGNEMNTNENWDMGHLPERRYADLHKDYMDGKIDKDQFLKEYRNPNNYRPELPSSNRSDNARPIR